MNQSLTLVVDDEPDIRELLTITLARMGIESLSAENLRQAKSLCHRHRPKLCLTDMKLPDGDGLELVEWLQQQSPAIPVAVITAHGNMETAVKAMKAGAFDFISKPIDLADLRKIITQALQLDAASPEKERRTRHILLGESPAMCSVRGKIAKLARSQAPVYINGESGSGKELVARLIHQQSSRSEKPFVAVNCGAIPAELMESEFFGHKKGSFTGAVGDKPGFFQAADGGSLFLDEVGDLPLSLQVKLLRAIQEKKVRMIGEVQEIPVDVRILSASHKSLKELVDIGRFRQDLYYRINVIDLFLPPLRQRRQDIIPLAEHLLAKLSGNQRLSEEAKTALQHYSYPGNVRELENILQRALALSEGGLIEPDDLALPIGLDFVRQEQSAFDPSQHSLEDYLAEIERAALLDSLEQHRWNKTAAAKALGITFRSLRYRLKKLGIDD